MVLGLGGCLRGWEIFRIIGNDEKRQTVTKVSHNWLAHTVECMRCLKYDTGTRRLSERRGQKCNVLQRK